MRRKGILGVLLAVLVPAAPGFGADEGIARTISVAGEGRVAAAPDLATIQTGVVTHARQAREAVSANNEATERLLATLEEHGIAAKDVQTSSFDVRPEYERDARGVSQPEIVGYRVTNQVRVRVRDLARLGRVLDAVVQAGSNQISGIVFDIDDPTDLLDAARKRAVADARRRAELYAAAAGVRVGRVLTISEESLYRPPPQPLARAAAMEMQAAVPVATGEQEPRARVHVLFGLEDAR
jgi:uncharacterized protein YggE